MTAPLAQRRRRAREVLLEAMLPAPVSAATDPRPALAVLDLGAFWRAFDAAAPAHVRWGLRAAVALLYFVLPVSTTGRTLRQLSPEGRERALARAMRLPLCRDLAELVKVLACFAYFEDPGVDAAIRARGRT